MPHPQTLPERSLATPWRVQNLTPLLTAGIALLVYTLTLAPDYSWAHHSADSGDLITAVYTLGIPHPPGYPTYVWLGYLIARLPFPFGPEIIAVRFHWLSTLSTAVSVALLTHLALTHLQNYPARQQTITSLTTALFFAFTPLVWQQAIITEVYALNLALFTAVLWATLTQKPAWLIGLLAGLSSTTHLTSIMLWPLVALLLPRPKWAQACLGLLLGLTPWLTLFGLGHSDSPVLWGDPTTLSGWWWLVSGALYRPNLFAATLPEIAMRLRDWWWLWSTLGIAGIGVWLAPATQKWAMAGVWLTAVFYLLYAVGYGQPDALVFALPSLLLLHSCLPFIWAKVWLKLRNTAVVLPLLLLAVNWSTVSLAHQPSLRPELQKTLAHIPTNSVVLTSGGDRTIFTLWYFQHVEGWRPDLVIIDSDLLAFNWYRRQQHQHHPHLQALHEDNLGQFITANAPLCTLTLTPVHILTCGNK